jgi:hypothetical protein
MRPIGDAGRNWQAASANALARPRALQKPAGSGDLLGKSPQAQEQKPSPRQQDADPSSPQLGTAAPVSFRHDGPRLTAPFTAQLLGQILPDTERRGSAAKAYGRLGGHLSGGFDELL